MATPRAEKLIEAAQKGVRLSSRDRRHCIAYIEATSPEVTQKAMAELFQVSERMIRLDKEKLRKQKAAIIKNEDVALVIADIAMCFERQVKDMEASKVKCKLGTPAYLSHCKTIFNTQLLKVKALQDLGYYPKNLGQLTVDKFEFKAVVSGDQVTTRPVNLKFDQETQTYTEDGPVRRPKQDIVDVEIDEPDDPADFDDDPEMPLLGAPLEVQ
jgi:hypothetical protein